jgi:hypothetical protein
LAQAVTAAASKQQNLAERALAQLSVLTIATAVAVAVAVTMGLTITPSVLWALPVAAAVTILAAVHRLPG